MLGIEPSLHDDINNVNNVNNVDSVDDLDLGLRRLKK
jgi:hypothetical protein